MVAFYSPKRLASFNKLPGREESGVIRLFRRHVATLVERGPLRPSDHHGALTLPVDSARQPCLPFDIYCHPCLLSKLS
jgi:hypothetical protein